MITSHRDRRAFQNYGYFSRLRPIRHTKSSNLARALSARLSMQPDWFACMPQLQHLCWP